MKKISVIIISLLIINFLYLASVMAADGPVTTINTSITPEQIEGMKNKAEQKWDYLSRSWRDLILKNKVVSSIDSFFQVLDKSYIFPVLFGIHWLLSVTVILVMIFWIFFLFYIKRVTQKFSGLSKLYCYLISFGIVILLAQAKFWLIIANEAIELFTTTTGKFILAAVFLIGLWVLFFIDKYLGKYIEELRKGKGVSQTQKEIEKFGESLRKNSKEA